MDSYAHKIAKFILKRIELVADYFAVQFSYDKIGMGGCNILEGECIVTPEVLEAHLLDGKQRWYISLLNRSQFYLGVSCRGDIVVILIVGVKQALKSKASTKQYISHPIILHSLTVALSI